METLKDLVEPSEYHIDIDMLIRCGSVSETEIMYLCLLINQLHQTGRREENNSSYLIG